jgi:hypothetical protein
VIVAGGEELWELSTQSREVIPQGQSSCEIPDLPGVSLLHASGKGHSYLGAIEELWELVSPLFSP